MSRVPEIAAAMDEIKRKFGRIDALFANAGIGRFVPFEEVTEEFFDQTMATNLKGVFFTVQKAVPLFPRGAAVVLNASINAHMGMPTPASTAPRRPPWSTWRRPSPPISCHAAYA